MRNKHYVSLLLLPLIFSTSSCGEKISSGYTKINYQVEDRERYTNSFDANQLQNQWEDYGVGDPYILRFNGEYYLYCSTKDNQHGYRVWKSRDLLNYEYLGQYEFLGKDGTFNAHYGQYAPEVYYWNGDFYCYGSPAGRGHYVYKSLTRQPFGDFQAVTDNLGLNIDGSVFIDDDESMTFLTAGNGAIRAYEMNSMESINEGSETELLSPLVRQTEGPFMIKHDDSYFLTYAGNHVMSTGYRVAYSYSEVDPFTGFKYPSNNPIVISTNGEFVGLGHSATVLGPNLDSYYMAYHNLIDQSGPKRAFNINRIFFSKNRMAMYGPDKYDNLAPLLPTYSEYDSTNLLDDSGVKLTNESTGNRFTAEYNFSASNINDVKLHFGVNNINYTNYVALDNEGIYLYLNNNLVGEGYFNHSFDFTVNHSVRLVANNGRYAVFFDNMKKIDVDNLSSISGGRIGYEGTTNIGATIFSNEAFDSSDKTDPKSVPGTIYASNYLKDSSNVIKSSLIKIDEDDYDYDCIYSDSEAVKLTTPGEYTLYAIDVKEDYLYGFDLTFNQKSAGSQLSIQIDNNKPFIFTLPSVNFSKNMNSTEKHLKYIKAHVAEMEISKGLHTLKIELCKGKANIFSLDSFKESKYLPNYQNDLSTYVATGANYLSLWKIAEDQGVNVHKAKAGSNNMIVFGDETLTDYEVSVDIKVDVSAAVNAMAGIIVRCNNPTLYTGYVDQSAQGYLVGFNRLQLVTQKINYSSEVVAVQTGPQYTLGEWHNLKIIAKGNRIRVFYDEQEHQSYTDACPFTHGSIALYSINSESYYKNLSIKGI